MSRTKSWISWNVRGLGGSTRRLVFKKEIQSLKLDVIFIQETKIEEDRLKVI